MYGNISKAVACTKSAALPRRIAPTMATTWPTFA
jgi:hypothetical protein